MQRVTSLFAVILTAGLIAAPPTSAAPENYVIATDSAYHVPFEYEDMYGNFVGIDVDLINAIAEDQHFGITVNRLEFDDPLRAVQAGDADAVIAAMAITDERRADFDFSEPYFEDGAQMGVLENTGDISSYDDLRGQRVAVETDTDAARFAESIKDSYGFTIAVFDDIEAALDDVRYGESQAVFSDTAYLNFEIALDNGFKTATPAEDGPSLGFAVKKGQNTELLALFNAGLRNLKQSGAYEQIVGRYLGQPRSEAEPSFLAQLIAMLVEKLWLPALLGIIALIVVAGRRIAARVRRPKGGRDDPEIRIRELERSVSDSRKPKLRRGQRF